MNDRTGSERKGRTRRILLVVILVGVALRLIYSFFIFPVIGDRLHWRGVDDGYDEIARNILDGHGFVDAPGRVPNLLTPPGYVYFLTGLYALTGQEVNEGIRIWLIHPLLDGATCLLIYLLGMLCFRNRKTALAGAIFWAVYPQIIVYNARVAPEVLFTFLVTLTVYFWVRLQQNGRQADAIAAGASLALAMLVKEKLILLPPLLLLVVLLRPPGGFVHRIRLAVATGISILVVLTPWLVRGYDVTGGFVPITMRSGRAIDQGLDESFAGADTMLVRHFETREETADPQLPETIGLTPEELRDQAAEGARAEKDLIGRSLERILDDPLAYARAFLTKSGAFWYFGQPKVIAGNMAIQLPVLFLAVAGYWTGRRRHFLMPFLLITIYFVVIHALTIVRMRYSIPIMPETALVAASFLFARRGKGE